MVPFWKVVSANEVIVVQRGQCCRKRKCDGNVIKVRDGATVVIQDKKTLYSCGEYGSRIGSCNCWIWLPVSKKGCEGREVMGEAYDSVEESWACFYLAELVHSAAAHLPWRKPSPRHSSSH